MRTDRAQLASCVLFFTLMLANCASFIRYDYSVEEEEANDLAAVQAARQIWARELTVSFSPPPDWEYPEERWEIVGSEIKKRYAAWIVVRLQTAGPTVTVVSADDDLSDREGVVLEADLTRIERGSHGWTGTGVGMTKRERGWATVTFRAPGSGRVLYTNRLTMESGVGSADGGFGFKDRVMYLGWHIANSVLDLLQQEGSLGIGRRNQAGKL